MPKMYEIRKACERELICNHLRGLRYHNNQDNFPAVYRCENAEIDLGQQGYNGGGSEDSKYRATNAGQAV